MRHQIDAEELTEVPYSVVLASSVGGGYPSKRLSLSVFVCDDGSINAGYNLTVDGKDMLSTTDINEAVDAYNAA